MNELTKTLTFVGSAVVVSLVAFLMRPSVESTSTESLVGTMLFPAFTDPSELTGIKIVKFDEALSKLTTIQVEKVNDRWVIPTHGNYPADAEKQLAEAAGGLIDIKVLDIASQETKDHAYYGVVEPSEKDLKVGSEGVGTLVVLDKTKAEAGKAKSEPVLRLIIGKKLSADSAAGEPNQYFVRIPEQAPVYVVAVNTEKLVTNFDAWIERDLLRLNALDVEQVTLKDYSTLLKGNAVQYYPKMVATAKWLPEEGSWMLSKMQLFQGNTAFDAGLSDTEELNKEKLDTLKTALDDLKIEDVEKKPKGLGANLRASSDNFDDEGFQTLVTLGFVPIPSGNNEVEIYATNGEVLVDMKDGVQYVLRFGNVQGAQEGSEEGKLNRFLLVTAKLSEAMLVPPTAGPTAIPPAPPAIPPSASGGGGADPASEEKPAAEEKPATEAAGAEKPATEKPATEKPATEAAPEVSPEEKEFQRKLDEYNLKRKKAEQTVAELNARFADWFYVISEDTYKKIHLSRTDIIKEGAAAKDEGFGIDAFRKLEKDGIEPAPAAPPGGGNFPGGIPGLPGFGN